MNLVLPKNATSAEAIAWLQQLILDFGPGFHPDTLPSLYVLPNGQPALTLMEALALQRSLSHLFQILGDVSPYEVGAEALLRLLTQSVSRNA